MSLSNASESDALDIFLEIRYRHPPGAVRQRAA